MHSFNLVDEPWIPVRPIGASATQLMGLRDVLLGAHAIRELVDPSPLVTVSLHRLLLAILHRVFGPRDDAEWAELYEGGSFPLQPLEGYLQCWHDRFDLFHEKYPFYQKGSIQRQSVTKLWPVTRLAPEIASPGNATTLFDHTLPEGVAFTPDRAARYLVSLHPFTVGGLFGLLKGEKDKAADAGPLAKCAVVLLRGRTLFETLMLNMVRYDPEFDEPCPSSPEDSPAWERDDDTQPVDRLPKGYLDYLTWQSRRVRLFPEVQDGRVVVREVIIVKGCQLRPSEEIANYETMVAFRKNPRAGKGENPRPPVGFREDRAMWRDSHVIFQSTDTHTQPRSLRWIAELIAMGRLQEEHRLPLEIYGIITDQANIKLWRHEVLPVSTRYFSDRNLYSQLQRALAMAESVGQELDRTLEQLARDLLPNPNRDEINNLRKAINATPTYWASLEVPFHHFLLELEADRQLVQGRPIYGYGYAMRNWMDAIKQAGRLALEFAVSGLDGNARNLRAAVNARGRFNGRLNTLLAQEAPGLELPA